MDLGVVTGNSDRHRGEDLVFSVLKSALGIGTIERAGSVVTPAFQEQRQLLPIVRFEL